MPAPHALPVLLLLFSLSSAFATSPVPSPYQAPAATDPADWPNEKLTAFMRKLTDFVYDHHVVTDPSRRTFGMTYEFWRDDKKIQEFGLDAMHDGAWFASAMATAQRADSSGTYLPRVLKYQAPFYIQVLRHSDRLFPQMQPRKDQEKFTAPIRGWIPRGWDDGLGFDLQSRSFSQPGFQHADVSVLHREGNQVVHSYFTSSHHLFQDVADSLLNIWLSTRDPGAAEAVQLLHQGRVNHGHVIPVVKTAAGLMLQDEKLAPPSRPKAFDPAGVQPVYSGFYQFKGHAWPSYNDGAAWQYREWAARFALGEDLDTPGLLSLAFTAFSQGLAGEIYFADGSYRYGLHPFDLGGAVKQKPGAGKYEAYAHARKTLYGPRGVQIDSLAAAALPLMRRQPDLWAERRQRQHPTDRLLPISDDAGAQLEKLPPQIETDGVGLTLASDPFDLHLKVESARPEVTLSLKAADPVAAPQNGIHIALNASGEILAANPAADAVLLEKTFTRHENGWTARLRLPYTFREGQTPWLNGCDHARFVTTLNEKPVGTLYLLSDGQRVIDRLQSQALGSIALWHDYWKKHGVIPSGIASDGSRTSWNLSDAGNYAHLIKLIAFVLIDRHGAGEWEITHRQLPAEPRPIPPLPETVIRAQGL